MIEHKLIKIIESLNRIMDKWNKQILRRTILTLFTITIFVQTTITFILWVFGKDICNTWLGVLTVEFTAWGTMLAFYFNTKMREEEMERKEKFEMAREIRGREEDCNE